MEWTPQDLFRRKALDHLAAPDQLDTALRVTDRQGWLALVACGACLAAVLTWSFYGKLPTRVLGRGILVSKSGLNSVSVPTAGQVAELYVQVGTRLARGQTVARLLQPELELELRNARASLAAAEDEHRRLSLFGSEEARLRAEAIRQQRSTALGQLATARERRAALADRLAAQQDLLADGLVTEAVVQATRDNLNQAADEIKRAQAALAEADLADKQNEQRQKRDSDERLLRIDEARRKVDSAESRIRSTSLVASPAAGSVLEVRTAPGQFVPAGAPLVMLELAGEHNAGLRALLYLTGADGKRLRVGMSVEVSPSTVRREEYGALRGVVRSVSAFPATQQAMLADLGNPELVAGFFKSIEAPIQVEADLLVDARTPSGYQWTSRLGPPTTVQPGTLCTASITVREQSPISLLLPLLHERLGL
jgi:HlyD family secretion protein